MEYPVDYFIKEIYSLEAEGMFADLVLNPSLFSLFMNLNEDDRAGGITYIKSILEECYKCGHLRVAISHENGELCGYSMMFVHPDAGIPKYLHKIYVKEDYRGNGIGEQILKAISENELKICLICPPNKIPFYEKYGFNLVADFSVPESENFSLSRDMYSDLYIMSNFEGDVNAPIFLLNDKDIRKIIANET